MIYPKSRAMNLRCIEVEGEVGAEAGENLGEEGTQEAQT
jgi:hypothetical protein